MFAQDDESTISMTDPEQYLRGYQNAIDDVKNKLKLRSRDLVINKGRQNQNQPSASKKNQEKEKDTNVHKNSENIEQKSKENKHPMAIDEEKPISSFNLQVELAKINISILLNELLRNNEYREKITKLLKNQGDDHPDILEVTDDYENIVHGPKIEETDDEEAPPFLFESKCT